MNSKDLLKIPAIEELSQYNQWVVWRYDTVKGKRAKVPYCADRKKGKASSTDPATWSTFEAACSTASLEAFDGIGYVFAKDDPYTGIDFDACLLPDGEIAGWAKHWLDQVNGYAEVSPSGTGVKVFVRGRLPERARHKQGVDAQAINGKEPAIEVYDNARFFVVTGDVWQQQDTITEQQNYIDAICQHFSLVKPPARGTPTAAPPARQTEEEYARGYLARLAAWRCDDYNSWLAVGVCLRELGAPGLALWEGWSRQSEKFAEGDCGKRWDGLQVDPHGIAKLGAWANEDSPRHQMHHHQRATTTSAARPGAGNGTARAGGVPGVDLGEKLGLFDLGFVGQCAQSGDQGDAQLLAALYHDTLLYDVREKTWYVWYGHFWRRDTTGTVRRLLSGQILGQYLLAAARYNVVVEKLKGTEDESEKADLAEAKAALSACYAKVTKLNHTSGTKNVITFAECYLPFEGAWDAQPYKLACQNGVVDLRTGALEPGAPGDYIRTAAPLDYDPDAKCPRFEQFIAEVLPDSDTAAYLQRLLGYGISGLTTEHILPVLWGPGGRNGKDVLIRAVQSAMGACAATVHPDVVMGQDRKSGAAEPHKVALQGLRLGFANETREGARLNEEQVKVLTGGGDINARGLHEHLRTFTPTHLLFLITNWLPRASSEDSALWERLRVIKFTQRFVDNPTESNEHKRDSLLAGKLANETAGILRWLVDGFRSYQQQGETPPDSVRVETANMRNENDIIGTFVGDCCVVVPAASVVASRLYEEYRQWCHSSGHKPFSGKRFGQKISARFAKKRTEKGMTYQGVGLLASEAHTPQHQPYIDDIAHSNGVEPVEGEGENVGYVGFGKSFELYATRNEKVCPNPTYPTFGGGEDSDISHSDGAEGQCRVENGTEAPQPGGEPARKWKADEVDGKPLLGSRYRYYHRATGKPISPALAGTDAAKAWYATNVEG